MKKQQLILLGSGALLFCLIYFLGSPTPPKSGTPPSPTATEKPESATDIKSLLAASRQQLSTDQQAYLSQLETAVVRGDVKAQQIKVYRQIADFWKDSAHLLLPYAFYTGQAAKLENSEKSLTFAGHFFLDGLRRQSDPAMKKWMGLEARELFENALKINPLNDSTKIGLGSCYLFAPISENPMTGIQLIREVAERNPDNLFAQFMLGLGGMESGQYDKAIERLLKVTAGQPDNLEAFLGLAECYERRGDKANAIKWYEASKKFFTEKEIVQELEQRINLLKK